MTPLPSSLISLLHTDITTELGMQMTDDLFFGAPCPEVSRGKGTRGGAS